MLKRDMTRHHASNGPWKKKSRNINMEKATDTTEGGHEKKIETGISSGSDFLALVVFGGQDHL
jgi:hypothetical protein